MNKTSAVKSSPSYKQKRSNRRLYDYHRLFATELIFKSAMNGVLCVAAIATLTKLLPYHISQQSKLQEVRNEVIDTEKRVSQLQKSFGSNFVPTQTKTLIQDYSPLVAPNQRRVFWLDEKNISPQNSATSNQ